MAEPSYMFSESWHRVASQRIALRPTLRIRRQFFRGERWYVLQDPFSNRFYRFRPKAYNFLARLSAHKTVDEVWRECMDLAPGGAPGQQETVQLLAELYQANLIQSDISPDSAKLFERQRKQKQKELGAKFTSALFIRIPLWDPQHFLQRAYPFVKYIMNHWMAWLWLLVVGGAVKIVFENFGAATDRTQEILAPGNIPLLLVTFFIIKIFHEMGHAFACTKFGGEVHTTWGSCSWSSAPFSTSTPVQAGPFGSVGSGSSWGPTA